MAEKASLNLLRSTFTTDLSGRVSEFSFKSISYHVIRLSMSNYFPDDVVYFTLD